MKRHHGKNVGLKTALPIVAFLFLLAASASAQPKTFSPRGIGGGGGLFSPAISDLTPNLMLVASDMGGVYRSTDGGAGWTLIPTWFIEGVAGATPPAFFREHIFWYSGYTLYESGDQGLTWTRPKWPWKPRRRISGLTAYRAKGRELLFVSTHQDLWRYDLVTEKWDMVRKGDSLAPVVVGDELFVVSDNRLMASRDRGATWTALQGLDTGGSTILTLAGTAAGTDSLLLACVENKGIFRSADNGRTWEKTAPFDNQSILQLCPGQVRTVWAAEQKKGRGKKIWKSEDGGRSWDETFRFSGFRRNVDYSWVESELRWGYVITTNGFFASRTEPETAIATSQGDMYRTTDGGRTWRSLVNRPMGKTPDGTPRYASIGLEMTSCYQYLFDPWEKNRHYAAFTDIGALRSLDGGKTWSHAAKGSPWPNTFYRIRFDPKIPGRLYAAASNRHDIPHRYQLGWKDRRVNIGGIVVSDDFGATWSVLSKTLPVAPCTDVILDYDPATGTRTFYASLYENGIYKSGDDGRSWREVSRGIDSSSRNFLRLWRNPSNGDIYALITAHMPGKGIEPGSLWRSTDRGETWRNLTASRSFDWPTSFYVDPENEKTIYLSVASAPGQKPQQGGVWKTSDGGATWECLLDDKGLTGWRYDNLMVVSVNPHDRNLLYAGGVKCGLWVSEDGGKKWRHSTAYPFKSAESVNFNPDNPDEIVVTSFGAGLWVGPARP